MFGLPGAALAMYHTAKPERKPQVKALLIAAIIPSIFTGITDPIEYSFLFAACLLFVVHAGYAGLAYLLTYICKVNIPGPSSFGGPFPEHHFQWYHAGRQGLQLDLGVHHRYSLLLPVLLHVPLYDHQVWLQDTRP